MTPLESALADIEAGDDRLFADLSHLLAFDTVYPPARDYTGLVDWAEARFGALGFACRRVVVPQHLWDVPGADAAGERVNLIAELPGKDPVAIYSHIDVVPPGEGWTVPPLAATRRGEEVWGRGSADMKGTIAATLLAIEAAQAHGVTLRYAPRVLLTTDEEGGAYPGIRYLAEQGMVGDHLICLDGSADPRIWHGSFGSLEMQVVIEGRSGHAGQRGSGDNALERAIPILSGLMELKQVVEQRSSAVRGKDGGPLRPILAVTVMQSGTKANNVPARAVIGLNRRYAPEERDDDALAEIREAVARAAPEGTRWELRVTGHLAAVLDADQGPHWPRWQKALEQGFGWPADSFHRSGSTGSSDMGWVQRAGLREIMITGASRPDSRVHGADERVRLADLRAMARTILFYLAADFPAH